MCTDNTKRDYQHYLLIERALRSISDEVEGGPRYFNAGELECRPLDHLRENWEHIKREHRPALEGWRKTIDSLKSAGEELSQDQLDSFAAEVMRVGGWSEDAIRKIQKTY